MLHYLNWFYDRLIGGKTYVCQKGNITFLSKHPVLHQVSRDILQGISPDFDFPEKLTVYCGIHKKFGLQFLRRGKKLGIQSEHFVDQSGNILWKMEKVFPFVKRNFHRFDRVLDLNKNNDCVYENHAFEDREKITFGPYIFPRSLIDYVPGKSGKLLFFGSARKGRRKEILGSLNSDSVEILPEGTYGETLTSALKDCRGVLNIHFDQGVYAEYPRLLTAILAGKPVASEELGDDLIAGQHFISVEDIENRKIDDHAIFRNLAEHVSQNYAFETYLTNWMKKL